MTTSFRFGLIAACLIAAAMTAGVVCIGATGKEVKDDTLTKLFDERAELAEKAYQCYAVAYQAGTVTLDSLLVANKEMAEAKLPNCKTKKERIGARETQVKNAKDIEAQIRALNNVNAKGGEFEKLYLAGVERVKAEIALELERRDAAGAVK
jgi:hypothetical protein